MIEDADFGFFTLADVHKTFQAILKIGHAKVCVLEYYLRILNLRQLLFN